MIPPREFEKNILINLDFGNRILNHRIKFKKQIDFPTIPKSELVKIFKELKINIKSGNGGYYSFYREYKKYTFCCQFHITKNSVFTYIYIYIDGKLDEEAKLGHYSYMLNFIPYNVELAKETSNTFGINTRDEMKEYLRGLIDLFHLFTDEYIKEIEAGNAP